MSGLLPGVPARLDAARAGLGRRRRSSGADGCDAGGGDSPGDGGYDGGDSGDGGYDGGYDGGGGDGGGFDFGGGGFDFGRRRLRGWRLRRFLTSVEEAGHQRSSGYERKRCSRRAASATDPDSDG